MTHESIKKYQRDIKSFKKEEKKWLYPIKPKHWQRYTPPPHA